MAGRLNPIILTKCTALLISFMLMINCTLIGERDNQSDSEYILVEAGVFQMGSATGFPDERPAHTVILTRAFYIAKTEVTQASWERVMGDNPSAIIGKNQPVTNVSWHDAVAFCNALSDHGGVDAGVLW